MYVNTEKGTWREGYSRILCANPPRDSDDNGVGKPGPHYEFDREFSDDCYWINGYDMIVDCYGNIIWER